MQYLLVVLSGSDDERAHRFDADDNDQAKQNALYECGDQCTAILIDLSGALICCVCHIDHFRQDEDDEETWIFDHAEHFIADNIDDARSMFGRSPTTGTVLYGPEGELARFPAEFVFKKHV